MEGLPKLESILIPQQQPLLGNSSSGFDLYFDTILSTFSNVSDPEEAVVYSTFGDIGIVLRGQW